MKGLLYRIRLWLFIYKVRSYNGVRVSWWNERNREIHMAAFISKHMDSFLSDKEKTLLSHCIEKKIFVQRGVKKLPADRDYTEFLTYPVFNV